MKSSTVRLPRETILAIKKDLKAGYTFRDICAKYHVATKTIALVREMKTVPRDTGYVRGESFWPCKHSNEKLEMIKKARKAGTPVKDIARIFGVSESYASNIINGRERSAEKH